MPDSLRKRAISGIIWSGVQKYAIMIIQFISGIILARLLSPFDYGCIGMISIFMVLAQAFIEGGFGSALIQKKCPSQDDYSTIFIWNLGMAAILYIVLFFSAPAIASFYNIPLLRSVLRIQAIVLFFYAFNIIQKNQLQKRLDFKLLSIVSVIASVVSLAITIIMAYKGFGVWSLVTQNLITAAIPAILFWFIVKWRPKLVFSFKSFKELFSFGVYMFLTHLINSFGQQIQGLLIGKVYNPSTMGYYSKAQGTEKLASTSISQVMTQVTYPLYAEVQDDKTKLENMIKSLTITLSYITFPLMFLLILLAKPLFIMLYSDKWLQSVPYFQVLCIAGLAYCLQSVNLQAISAIGKSRTMFLWALFKRAVGILLVVGGLFLYGMKGLLFGAVLDTWFAYFVNISLVSKHIGYKWYRQLLDISPILVASMIAALLSFGISSQFSIGLYPDAVLKFFIYCIIYIGWSLIFKPKAFASFISVVPERFRFWR